MSVGLSITLSQDIQVSNFACNPIVETFDADVTSGESKWSGLLHKPEEYKKNFKRIKFIAINGTGSISCADLMVKYSVGMGMLGWGGNKHLLQNYLVL